MTSLNMSEKTAFVDYWKEKADFVDVQRYVKTYEDQPDEIDESVENSIIAYQKMKRMAIVAPDFLCTSCGGREVERSVAMNHTLSHFKTIKQYWDYITHSD